MTVGGPNSSTKSQSIRGPGRRTLLRGRLKMRFAMAEARIVMLLRATAAMALNWEMIKSEGTTRTPAQTGQWLVCTCGGTEAAGGVLAAEFASLDKVD